MSTTTTSKRPTAPGPAAGRRPSTNPIPAPTTGTTPNRSPSRMAPQNNNTANGTATAPGINRSRSVRASTPSSARAAVRKQSAPSDTADADVKAEMQAKMEELHEQLRQAEQASSEFQKQTAVLQVRLDDALKEQGLLEESVHEHTERINDLENEKKEGLRARREMEQIYETERAAAIREKEEAQLKQEEAHSAVQRMKETLASKEMRAGLDDERRPSMSRNSSFRNNGVPSPNPDAGQFAPPSSLQRSDSRNNSKLLHQKDKVIEGLRMELAEVQIKLVEMENMGGGRHQKLEAEMYEIKVQNARLMEENESFQLLLSEKTLNGDFSQSEFLRAPSIASRPGSRGRMGNSLADELEGEEEGEQSEDARKLHAENSSLKEQNKALTHYISTIISRLLQHDQFESILDKTPDLMAGPNLTGKRFQTADTEKELPPPPPEKDDQEAAQPAGFLSRARSVMGARKPRPQSQILPSDTQIKGDDRPKVTENPETAPKIPLSRSNTNRLSGSHRRANSEWAAASVVNSMYRGISPGISNPTSPGLTSPGSGRSYFASPQPLGVGRPSPGVRTPSNTTIPPPQVPTTISEANKENITSALPPQQRDSKISARNSVVSPQNMSDLDAVLQDHSEPSQPNSPPRSVTSSGDRDNKPSGAIMMGSKMRPLRLVQDTREKDEAAKKAANRGSWFGFLNKGAQPAPGRSVSGGPEGQ